MRALCVSNDSRIFRTDGRNNPAERIPGLMERLERTGLPFPGCEGDDSLYGFLEDYRAPAKEFFGGRFTEVRNLASSLPGAELAVISGRYGLVDGEELLLPYRCYVESKEEVGMLQRRTRFVEALQSRHADHDLLLFLPRAFMECILSRWQGPMDRTIAVTSPSLFPELESRGAACLPRRGPRVGSANAESIRRMVEGGADAGI